MRCALFLKYFYFRSHFRYREFLSWQGADEFVSYTGGPRISFLAAETQKWVPHDCISCGGSHRSRRQAHHKASATAAPGARKLGLSALGRFPPRCVRGMAGSSVIYSQ